MSETLGAEIWRERAENRLKLGWYWARRSSALREEVLRLEALVRAKDETIGELLELIPDGLGEGTWTRIDHLAAEDWRQYHEDIRLGRFS